MSSRACFVSWAASLVLAYAGTAAAEWRCDCLTIVDSCQAQVVLQTNAVEVTVDRPQCARVDYFVDGVPFVAVAVDGRARQDWVAPGGTSRVVVQSCQVCLDRATADMPARSSVPGAAAPASDALEPFIAIEPTYPPAAWTRGLDGHVDLEFLVTPDGLVSEPAVVAAEPAGLFEAAALDAVRRWRYPAQAGRDAVRVSRRLEFSLAEHVWQLQDTAGLQDAAPSAQVPLNSCVREGAVYHYGDVVEVDLLNACREPVLVFACAEGSGASAGRWACRDSDTARAVLIAADDVRNGGQIMVTGDGGVLSYAYAAEFPVQRAPNSQAWWIACQLDDADCLSRARGWVRGLQGQMASVDPRARTELRVARSH